MAKKYKNIQISEEAHKLLLKIVKKRDKNSLLKHDIIGTVTDLIQGAYIREVQKPEPPFFGTDEEIKEILYPREQSKQ